MAAAHEFTLRAVRIPGNQNTAADAVSRNKTTLFFLQVPEINPHSQGPDRIGDSATARLAVPRLVSLIQELF